MLPDRPAGGGLDTDPAPDAGGPAEDFRTRRRRLVQDEVARIAIRLFLERGYDAVSVDEIAEAAGMSQRTFFRYFPTKDEVLGRYRGSLRQGLVQALKARPEGEGPVTALRAAYEQTSRVEPGDRPRVHAVARVLVAAPDLWARDLGETVLDESVPAELGRRVGAAGGDIRPAVVAAAVSSAAIVGWNQWVRSDGSGDPAAMVVAAIDLLGLSD
ncbi:TetR family transcriptional regulator [Actinomadura rugatobispora]|uniref:TetR family transcriptional regulator n=1 Tax=Actinomadura rugatobispora TaxID=1994 RepID=A0ABW1A4A6_9ACTN|nr:TetR family transcriptional regulator [Actinomadura rugatobispora]